MAGGMVEGKAAGWRRKMDEKWTSGEGVGASANSNGSSDQEKKHKGNGDHTDACETEALIIDNCGLFCSIDVFIFIRVRQLI